MHDVIIVGGGVVGLSIARELALQGLQVTLLDRQDFGHEASWAGAGILAAPPAAARSDDSQEIAAFENARCWPILSRELRESTGIDNGYRECGGIVLPGDAVTTPELSFRCRTQTAPAVRVPVGLSRAAQLLDQPQLARLEPQLAPATMAWREPQTAQVRNPRHLQALLADCRRLRVALESDCRMTGWECRGDHVRAVRTTRGTFSADRFVVAAGAWSTELLGGIGEPVDVVPVRGQMLLYKLDVAPLTHVIECGARYLVPRDDGHLLVGSTEELAGFEKVTTAEGLAGLAQFAEELLPAVRGLPPIRTWAGLRPWARRGAPWVGPAQQVDNVWIAAGHFRSGLQFSPSTAREIRRQLLGN